MCKSSVPKLCQMKNTIHISHYKVHWCNLYLLAYFCNVLCIYLTVQFRTIRCRNVRRWYYHGAATKEEDTTAVLSFALWLLPLSPFVLRGTWRKSPIMNTKGPCPLLHVRKFWTYLLYCQSLPFNINLLLPTLII